MTTTLLPIFVSISIQFGLPPNLLSSLCYVESKHDIYAVHEDDGGSNSLGVCQVKLATAQWLGFKGTEEQLMKPHINIYYAGMYLSKQRNRYNGSIEKAVIAYNVGHAKNLTSTEYSRKVLRQWEIKK